MVLIRFVVLFVVSIVIIDLEGIVVLNCEIEGFCLVYGVVLMIVFVVFMFMFCVMLKVIGFGLVEISSCIFLFLVICDLRGGLVCVIVFFVMMVELIVLGGDVIWKLSF